MGVPAHQFLGDAKGDGVEGKAALLLGDLGVKHHLQQQVAEFLAQVGVVRGVDGGGDLVGLFQQAGAQRGVGLFLVPGTAVGGAQRSDDGAQLVETGEGRIGRGLERHRPPA